MLQGWLSAGLDPRLVTVVRPSGKPPREDVRTLTSVPDGAVPIVLLGVKPQKLDEVAPATGPAVGPETVLISILAGVELASLRQRFPRAAAVVRAMPNTPVALRKGVTNLIADSADPAVRREVGALMSALGHVEWFEDEALFALAGHLTGAGPAFFYRFLDALAAAAHELGLPADQAARLAAAMTGGAAALAASSPEPPAELARRVASPGGTTEAGLKILDEEEALRRLVLHTIEASRRRGLEMAAAAR
jgi:pyrroline-5-carboxylate reductase